MKEEQYAEVSDLNEQSRPERPKKAVYSIIEKSGGKSFWLRLGIAYTNRDGSLNVYLDAMPVNGQLHIRDFPE